MSPPLQRSVLPADLGRSWFGRLTHGLGLLILVVVLVGGVAAAGWILVTRHVDRELASEIERRLSEQLGLEANLTVTIGSARRVEGRGIELRRLVIALRASHKPFAEIDELWLICNAELQDLINGNLQLRHIEARHVRVHATIDAAGNWDLPRFRLSHSSGGDEPATLTLEDGTLEITDARRPKSRPLVLRGIELDVKRPTTETLDKFRWSPALPWHVRGRCSADPLESCAWEALLDGQSSEFQARGVFQNLRLSPDLIDSMPMEPCPLLETAHALRGQLQGEFRVQRRSHPAGDSPVLRYNVDCRLTEGRIDDSRLSSPLTDVQAHLKLSEQSLVIDGASARAGQSTLYGWLRCDGYTPTSPVAFEVRARNFQVDRHLIEFTPASWHDSIKPYRLEGPINADVRASFDGRHWDPEFTVQCLDVDFEYEWFPYRLSGGTGYIEYKDGLLRTIRLQALAQGQPVRIDAQFVNPGENYTGSIEITADSAITIDDQLLTALDDNTERIVRSLGTRGAVTFQARFERQTANESLSKRIRVGIQQGAIQYAHFSYPVDRIRGSLLVTAQGWEIEELTGANDTAYIECRGGWKPAGQADAGLRLDFLATDLPLDDELQAALPLAGQRWWAQLRPRGTLDHLVVNVRLPPGAARPIIEATAEKRGVRQNLDGRSITVKPAAIPFQIDNVTGKIRYKAGVYSLEQLRGEHGRTVVQASGRSAADSDGHWQLKLDHVSVDRLHLDHDLLAALPPELGQGVARMQVSGPLRGEGRMEFEGDRRSAGPTRGQWDVAIDVENGGLQCGVDLERIRGEVRLTGQYSPQGITSRGELMIDSLLCRGIQFSSIRGPITLAGRQLHFGDAWTPPGLRSGAPRPITARVFGGGLVGDGVVAMGDEIPFRLEAVLNDADLAMLAREALTRRRDVLGKASAAVRLEGNRRGSHTLRGEGWIKCRDADIDQLPVTGAMLKQIGNRKNADASALSLSDVDFRIQDSCLYFPRIDFKGDALTLKGHGEMKFNRAVDLKFYTIAGRDDFRLPVLSPVLAEASRQIFEIEVTGTLDEPEVRRTVVPVINDALQQMFPELGERPADRTFLRRMTQPR